MTSLTPAYPTDFKYYHPTQVRYADLDTLHHVNNVSILEYVETARIGYFRETGVWDGSLAGGFGMVIASLQIDYLVSIQFDDTVRVGVRTPYIGGKSLRSQFVVESGDGKTIFARGVSVLVAIDQAENKTIRVPQEVREKLAAFEHNEELLA